MVAPMSLLVTFIFFCQFIFCLLQNYIGQCWLHTDHEWVIQTYLLSGLTCADRSRMRVIQTSLVRTFMCWQVQNDSHTNISLVRTYLCWQVQNEGHTNISLVRTYMCWQVQNEDQTNISLVRTYLCWQVQNEGHKCQDLPVLTGPEWGSNKHISCPDLPV